MASDKNLIDCEGTAVASASSSDQQQQLAPLTDTPDLSQLHHRTTELAAASRAAETVAPGDGQQ